MPAERSDAPAQPPHPAPGPAASSPTVEQRLTALERSGRRWWLTLLLAAGLLLAFKGIDAAAEAYRAYEHRLLRAELEAARHHAYQESIQLLEKIEEYFSNDSLDSFLSPLDDAVFMPHGNAVRTGDAGLTPKPPEPHP